jgi:hypothetical protein
MSKFKVGDRVRTLAKPSTPCYSNDEYFKAGEEFTVKEVLSGQETVRLVERGQCWHESRFELVPPDHTAAPQIEGLPEGYRVVRIGAPAEGESIIGSRGTVVVSQGYETCKCYVILEKFDQPAPVEPAEKVAPVFKVGDKVRLVDNTNYEGFPIGTVDTIVKTSPDIPSNGDLLEFEGPLGESHGMYAYRFEKVVESPDDLILQNLVPARTGIDRGWWVPADQFDIWKVDHNHSWIMCDNHAGKRHGDVLERSTYRLFVMCYRKDLPKAEKVTLTEYVAWDDNGLKCLIWTSVNPTIESDSLGAWDHAYPTGNTREIEIPLG